MAPWPNLVPKGSLFEIGHTALVFTEVALAVLYVAKSEWPSSSDGVNGADAARRTNAKTGVVSLTVVKATIQTKVPVSGVMAKRPLELVDIEVKVPPEQRHAVTIDDVQEPLCDRYGIPPTQVTGRWSIANRQIANGGAVDGINDNRL